MKLVLLRKDWVRLQILSRKISRRHMNEKGLEKLKIEYFQNMIRYYIHEKMTLDCAKSFQIIYDTLVADEKNEIDPAGTQKKTSFDNFVIFLLVASHDKEKMELLQVVKEKYARELEAAG